MAIPAAAVMACCSAMPTSKNRVGKWSSKVSSPVGPGMAAVIDDDLLGHFITEGSWDELPDALVAKYGGIATRVVSYFTGADVTRDPTAFERWGTLARRVVAASA